MQGQDTLARVSSLSADCKLNARCFDGRKNNSYNVSKLVVRALHSNFAMDNLENGP